MSEVTVKHTHREIRTSTTLRIVFIPEGKKKARREAGRYCYDWQLLCCSVNLRSHCSTLFLVFRKRNTMTNRCFLNTCEAIQAQPWQMLYVVMQLLASLQYLPFAIAVGHREVKCFTRLHRGNQCHR